MVMSEDFKRQQRWLYDNGFMSFTYGPNKDLNRYGQVEGEFLFSILTAEQLQREEDLYEAEGHMRRSSRHNCIPRLNGQ